MHSEALMLILLDSDWLGRGAGHDVSTDFHINSHKSSEVIINKILGRNTKSGI